MRPLRAATALLFLLLALPFPATATGPADLTYLTEDYYPFNYERDGRMQGLSVDLLREIWKRLGVAEQPIRVLPWARAYDRVRNEPNTVLSSMARSAAREPLFRWVGPISRSNFVLVALRSRDIRIRDMDDLRGHAVGTVIQDISDVLLEPFRDRARIEAVSSMEYNLKKLLAGRIDLIAYEEKALRRFVIRHGYDPENFVTVHRIMDLDVYYAFHRDTDPRLVRRFQETLDQIRSEPLYEELVSWHLR